MTSRALHLHSYVFHFPTSSPSSLFKNIAYPYAYMYNIYSIKFAILIAFTCITPVAIHSRVQSTPLIHVHNLFIVSDKFVPSKRQLLLSRTLPQVTLQATVSRFAYSRDLWDPTVFVSVSDISCGGGGGQVRFSRYIHVTRSIIPPFKAERYSTEHVQSSSG